jgi:cytochrome c peroxidase
MRVTTIVGVVVLAFSIEQSASSVGTYPWHLPRGLPVPHVPADNPISQLKIDLGRRLFYDTRLSGKGNYACATCHQQSFAFTDGLAHAVGSTGAEHARSTMTLTNVAYNVTYGWADPGLRTLEAQMLVPMFNEHPIELGIKGHEVEIVARFSSDHAMAGAFGPAFPDEPTPVSLQNIVKAIASFERTLVSADSPFDRYLYGDDKSAMTAAALRGKDLFFSKVLGCSECHASFNLSGPVTFERDASRTAVPQYRPLQCQRARSISAERSRADRSHAQGYRHGPFPRADPPQHCRDRTLHARRQHRDPRSGNRPLRDRRRQESGEEQPAQGIFRHSRAAQRSGRFSREPDRQVISDQSSLRPDAIGRPLDSRACCR